MLAKRKQYRKKNKMENLEMGHGLVVFSVNTCIIQE